jgi:hypothetical protein
MFAVAMLSVSASAQQPHHLLRGNMIPGQASQIRMMSSPAKAGQVQPVKVMAPEAIELSVVSGGSFVSTGQPSYVGGMQLGSLYRFRITGVQVARSFELYPSIELLDLLRPPKGLENDFPVPVVITDSDIREAIAGRLVTKVVYLEDPDVALPRGGTKDEQPYFDVSASEDPVRTADGLGRPMAILRIGSRVPTGDELANASMNAFNTATPSQATETYQPALKQNPRYIPPIFPATTRQVPPIRVPEAVITEQN